jgi:hypothetical protein
LGSRSESDNYQRSLHRESSPNFNERLDGFKPNQSKISSVMSYSPAVAGSITSRHLDGKISADAGLMSLVCGLGRASPPWVQVYGGWHH